MGSSFVCSSLHYIIGVYGRVLWHDGDLFGGSGLGFLHVPLHVHILNTIITVVPKVGEW